MPSSQYYKSLKDRGICMWCCTAPAINGLYCILCHKKRKDSQKKYNSNNKEKQAERMHDWYVRTKHLRALVSKATQLRIKREVIAAYGGLCKCCKESEIVFLDIDHVNGDGARHREQLKKEGRGFYNWLKANRFPCGFQVLCKNCNWAKYVLGKCPHERA